MVQFRNAATLRSFQTNKWLYYAKRRWRLLAVVLVVTNLLFLPNPMSQVPQKMGSTISGQSSPDSASPLAWSNNLLLEKHEECPATTEQQRDRVVLIRTYLQFWTGGTEALVQLAVAFQSWMPSHTFIEIATQFKRDPHRPCRWYPTFCDISEKSTDDLRPGDIYIVPEIFECPVDLVERGVQVYVWLLAGPPERLEWRQLQREGGCHFLSHNQCLARHLEFQLPRHQILLPYITKSYNGTIHNHRRENLILINTHDSLDSPEIEGIRDYCKSTNCTMLLAKGFNREQLVDLYERAKIIIAFCMVGCERTPIEAVLRGVVLITNTCLCGKDPWDFPIPSRNVPNNPDDIVRAVERVLGNFEAEQAGYANMRALYLTIGAESLRKDTECFLSTLTNTASVTG